MKKFEVLLPEYGEIEFFASEYQLDDGDLVFRSAAEEGHDMKEIGRVRAGCWSAVFMVVDDEPPDEDDFDEGPWEAEGDLEEE